LLFVSEPSGVSNLSKEGISGHKVKLVGNIMIDALKQVLPKALEQDILSRLGLEQKRYALLTMHRPSNVDNPGTFKTLLDLFEEISRTLPVVFPVHPRTKARMDAFRLVPVTNSNFMFHTPVNYLEALCLQNHSKVVFTDSGGMQEETTYLGIPCITLRDTTERPITVKRGTSTLVGNTPAQIYAAFSEVISGCYKKGEAIDLWDGNTATRIVDVLLDGFI
jgi:UDP-N-acetylglucosamine 2-epimerase (non-hydrolysing)